MGTRLVFWTGLGVVFGLLCERANRREPLGAELSTAVAGSGRPADECS
ncbi:MAG: hypothetical protein M3N18_13775 [Actinomycetota bacterium]|nr:hypothetical protein [Actinomycetota bacterium]